MFSPGNYCAVTSDWVISGRFGHRAHVNRNNVIDFLSFRSLVAPYLGNHFEAS
jgi:hypothetical protein